MADICKCKGFSCPLKNTCYRYLARPSQLQSYFAEQPTINENTNRCDHYWEVRDSDEAD
jgi:hypothetical protein